MHRVVRTTLLLLLLLLCVAIGIGAMAAVWANRRNWRHESAPVGIRRSDVSIRIDKSHYLLTVLKAGRVFRTYPIVLGRNPVDDKLREGDFCTPEGKFRIRDLYPHKQWGYFLWLDYPTVESNRKHELAKHQHRIPAASTVGSQIGIHGVPGGKDDLIDRKVNWTFGCISLKSADIAELYRCVQRGTPVEIAH